MTTTARPYQHPVSQRADWGTPPDVFAGLNAEFGFTLDACAWPHNAKCARYFTPDDDGLVQDWGREVVWCNPPYGMRTLPRWLKHAWGASRSGATVVLLVPARTDAGWWHDYAMRGEVRFLRGRLRFEGASYNAPFPSAVIVFRAAT